MGNEQSSVLVVDDDPAARKLLRTALESDSATVTEAATLAEARVLLRDFHLSSPCGVVLDRRLPDGDGLELLPDLADLGAEVKIVVCSNVEDAVEPNWVVRVPKTSIHRVLDALSPAVHSQGRRASLVEHLEAEADAIAAEWIEGLGWDSNEADIVGAAAVAVGYVLSVFKRPDHDSAAVLATSVAATLATTLPAAPVAMTSGLRVAVRKRMLDAPVDDDVESWAMRLDLALDLLLTALVEDASEHLRHEALTDPLTGLCNRRALNHDLGREAARSERHPNPYTLMAFDLDGLKRINDERGHAEGDALLRRMADALLQAVRTSDTCYRIGGDEFVVLLRCAEREHAAHVEERLSAIGAPTHSWGAATWGEDGDDWQALLETADKRLFERRRATGSGRRS